ncbi:MAG: hypothetical protein ACOY5H_05000 [Pseudomonadota bacterium]
MSDTTEGLNTGRYPIITRVDALRVRMTEPGYDSGRVFGTTAGRDGAGYVRFSGGGQVCAGLRTTGETLRARPADLERVIMREWLSAHGLRADHAAVTAALAESAATA